MTPRILVVQLADIGDLVLSTPALAALRDCFPDAHVALLTTPHSAPLVEGTGLVDEIIPFEKHVFDSPKALLSPANLSRMQALSFRLRRGNFDTILFFHHFTTRFGAQKFAALAMAAGSKRRVGLDNGNGFFLTDRLPDEGFGAQHQARYWLNLVGLLGADTSARPAQVAIAEDLSFLPAAIQPKFETDRIRIAIHPGSGGFSLARRWDADKFAAVADALYKEFDAEIILVGGESDDVGSVRAAMRNKPVDMSGRTNLPQLAAVLEACDLFIGSDGGVMHIAAAVGTPVVAIFGPSNPDAWRPWTPGGRSVVVTSGAQCSPCSYVGHSIGLRNGCEARTCMHMVTAGQVMSAARALLAQVRSLEVAAVSHGVGTSVVRELPYQNAFLPSRMVWNGASMERGASSPERVTILGVPVDAVTYDSWLALVERWLQDRRIGRPHHVCTVNPEFIMIAQKDPNFFNVLQRADLCIPDGVGLLWAARRLGHPLPERVTGSDGVPLIAERAAREGWRLFFLGAQPGVADRAAEILMARHPGLKIVGTYSGSPAPYEEDELVEQVNASGADILFVAYGAPVQDKWIARNLPRLRVKMAMGVGGAFDFIAGVVPRAPLWMQRLGLEWLYRLYLQPRRIRRMLRLPRFVLAVLRRGSLPPQF